MGSGNCAKLSVKDYLHDSANPRVLFRVARIVTTEAGRFNRLVLSEVHGGRKDVG